jgi:serine/threonine protein kinase
MSCSVLYYSAVLQSLKSLKENLINYPLPQACMDKAKKPFSTSEVKQLMIQFLSAVDHMHDKWYIHRDLKTTNLLYQNGVLCLCDFGLARKYGRCLNLLSISIILCQLHFVKQLFLLKVFCSVF